MHPPFGFALFYLRSVAPTKDYVDKITGRTLARVTTGQIYWGAVPFVVIQVVMVGIVIAFPSLVTVALDRNAIDPSKIEINVPGPEYEQESQPQRGGKNVPPKERSGAEQGGDLEKLFKQ